MRQIKQQNKQRHKDNEHTTLKSGQTKLNTV